MTPRYRIAYTGVARQSVRHLPPIVKPAIKAMIERLAEQPQLGKTLREELAGYWSLRFQRWRVIYVIQEEERTVEIHLVEKRTSVYETLKSLSH